MYPTWPSEELCAMLGQRVRDPLSLLYPSPSGDWLWQSRLVPALSTTTEEAGAMGGSCQLIDFSHSSRKAWRTISKLTGRSGRSSRLCPVSANSIVPQLVKNGAHKIGGARQQTAARPMEDSNTWGSQYLWTLSLLCVPFKILERLIYARVEQSSTHCSHRSRQASDTGGRP